MDEIIEKFNEAETKYREIKAKHKQGEITSQQVKSELKRLMIQDGTGRYWMLGGKSGKWYVHDGTQWEETDPFEHFKKYEQAQEEPEEEEAPLELLPSEKESEAAVSVSVQEPEIATASTVYEYPGARGAEKRTVSPVSAGTGQAEDAVVSVNSTEYEDAAAAVDSTDSVGTVDFGEYEDAAAAAESAGTGQAEDAVVSVNSAEYEDAAAAVDSTDSVGTVDFGEYEDAAAAVDPVDSVQFGESEDAAAAADYETVMADASDMSALSEDAAEYESQSEFTLLTQEESAGAEEQPFIPVETKEEKESDHFEMEVESHSYGASPADSVSREEADIFQTREQDQGIDTQKYREYYDSTGEEQPTAAAAAGEEEAEVNIEFGAEPAVGEEPVQEAAPGVAAVEVEEAVEFGEEAPAAEEKVPDEAVIPDIETDEGEAVYINCGICSSRIPPYAVYCTFCGANQKELEQEPAARDLKKKLESQLLVKYVNVASFLFFMGGVGIIVGVILGALFGVFNDFLPGVSGIIKIPLMLSETRGGVAGGMIFSAIGGIGGFILFAILSVGLSLLFNLVSFVFGGIRFRVKQ